MDNRRTLLVAGLFLVVVEVVFAVGLIAFVRNGRGDDCNCAVGPSAGVHTHGPSLASEVHDGMQLIFNIGPAAPLYQVVDGRLELCGDISDNTLKHITVDVIDARFAPGEWLPVQVDLTVRRAGTSEIVLQAATPATYSPGHGYHFGDNFALDFGAAYDWAVTISPVRALRQEGAQSAWTEPVTWEGGFALADDGSVVDKSPAVTPIGQFSEGGLHVLVGEQPAQALYDTTPEGRTVVVDVPPGSRYFVVEVTDHVVNYESRLPGAQVTVTFRQGDQEQVVPFAPVISPTYGLHYGANVALGPGTWEMTVEVAGLDFLRQAGAAIGLTYEPVRGTVTYEAVSNPA